MTKYNVEYWIDNQETDKIQYADFWNDEKKYNDERWYILDNNFSKMEHHLQKIKLPLDIMRCIDVLRVDFKRELEGVGIDLAAGNLWAVPYLFNLGKIDKLYCLDYSKHMLLKVGPKVLKYYKVPEEKIVLVFGSFYDLQIKDNSLDFVFLSQAFHHADKPDKLLSEIRRVLKPKGIVIIIGEHILNYPKAYLKYAIKTFISVFIPNKVQQKLFGKTYKPVSQLSQIFLPDSILGDHYYTIADYKSMFSKYGFQAKRIKSHNSNNQSFILVG